MTRRTGLSLATALASLALLSGCRPDESGVTVLRVATWGNPVDDSDYAKKLAAIYRRFEQTHPGVKVEVETVPEQYVSKMVLNHVAGVSPDVMFLDHSSSALFIDSHLVEDLTPYIKADPAFHLDDFFPNVVQAARRGDALYAVPQDFTPMVMYYNRKAFDEAHEPYPDGSWNFEQFRAVAKRLTRGDREYGFVFKNWLPGWIMWLWNNGGDVLDPSKKRAEGWLDSDANAQTFAYLRDLVNVDHSSPSPSQILASGVDLFANGQAAMTISGHWSLIDYKNAPKDPSTGKPNLDWHDLAVVAVPHNTPEANTVIYESGFAIPVGCKHEKLAWEFIKYMSSHDVQFDYNSSGIAVDARRDVANERATDPLERQFLGLIAGGRPPYGSQVEGWEFIETQGQNAMTSVLQSGTPPMVALAQAARRIDKEFEKE